MSSFSNEQVDRLAIPAKELGVTPFVFHNKILIHRSEQSPSKYHRHSRTRIWITSWGFDSSLQIRRHLEVFLRQLRIGHTCLKHGYLLSKAKKHQYASTVEGFFTFCVESGCAQGTTTTTTRRNTMSCVQTVHQIPTVFLSEDSPVLVLVKLDSLFIHLF